MIKRLGIIGAGTAAVTYAEKARPLGIETHCFAWREGARAADAVNVFHDISINEVETIAQMCRELRIGGLVHTSEATILPAARIAKLAGLVGNPVEVAARITDKWANRMTANTVEGICQPGYWHISDLSHIAELGIPYPYIIKPTSEAGKRGISVVRDKQEYEAAVAYSAREPNRSNMFIVEEFLPRGAEYCAETLSYHGRHYVVQVTEQVTSAPPHCLELGHRQPARLTSAMRARIAEVMDRLLTAIGVQNGACGTELKIVDGKIYLIEVNGRPNGDCITSELVELSTGYPFWKGAIDIAFDEFEPIDLTALKREYAGIFFINQYTQAMRPVFDDCQNHDWCYRKYVSESGSMTMMHNGDDVSYFIYHAKDAEPDFPKL